MKTTIKSILAGYHMAVGHRVAAAMVCALCAVGFAAFAGEQECSVQIGEVKSHSPWDGKFDVEYTLAGLAAGGDFKIAFDVTAGDKAVSVTNAAAKLANGTYTNTLDTVEIFGAITNDPSASVMVRVIQHQVKMVDVTVSLKTLHYGMNVPSGMLTFTSAVGEYKLPITNGVWCGKLPTGEGTWSFDDCFKVEPDTWSFGVQLNTLDCGSFSGFSDSVKSAAFKIEECNLYRTLHVTEDGTLGGTPVEGSVFLFTKEENDESIEVTTDSNGNATLQYQFLLGDQKGSYRNTYSPDHNYDNTDQVFDYKEGDSKTFEVINPPAL